MEPAFPGCIYFWVRFCSGPLESSSIQPLPFRHFARRRECCPGRLDLSETAPRTVVSESTAKNVIHQSTAATNWSSAAPTSRTSSMGWRGCPRATCPNPGMRSCAASRCCGNARPPPWPAAAPQRGLDEIQYTYGDAQHDGVPGKGNSARRGPGNRWPLAGVCRGGPGPRHPFDPCAAVPAGRRNPGRPEPVFAPARPVRGPGDGLAQDFVGQTSLALRLAVRFAHYSETAANLRATLETRTVSTSPWASSWRRTGAARTRPSRSSRRPPAPATSSSTPSRPGSLSRSGKAPPGRTSTSSPGPASAGREKPVRSTGFPEAAPPPPHQGP